FAPAGASCCASARPMPALVPVMTTAISRRFRMGSDCMKTSRDRKGAVVFGARRPLPYGRGSSQCLLESVSRHRFAPAMRSFDSLSEREILALAISLEEDDGRIYGDFADGVRQQYPATASALERMRAEEVTHRDRLLALYRRKFGEHLPMIRREHVRGFIRRRPLWMTKPLGIETIRRQASTMEAETRQFYDRAAAKTTDVSVRQLLNQLSDEEAKHLDLAHHLEREQ